MYSCILQHVFRKTNVVTDYVSGHNTAIRVMLAQQLRMIPMFDGRDLATVKQGAVSIGYS